MSSRKGQTRQKKNLFKLLVLNVGSLQKKEYLHIIVVKTVALKSRARMSNATGRNCDVLTVRERLLFFGLKSISSALRVRQTHTTSSSRVKEEKSLIQKKLVSVECSFLPISANKFLENLL